MLRYRNLLIVLMVLVLAGCVSKADNPKPNTPTAVHFAQDTTSHSPTPETTPTTTAIEESTLSPVTMNNDGMLLLPNLWTKIAKEKITIYPNNKLSDYAVAEDGSLWVAGGFGVIRRQPGGKMKWYSIKNGLPVNSFNKLVISPDKEIWIGGKNDALLRFDGKEWINEGENLPGATGSPGWLCYSKDIFGIDFDANNSIWVMDGGIGIYTKYYGQWIDFPFRYQLPIAGGGSCPLGMRVQSPDNITIKHSGCCDGGPGGIHYDGKSWQGTQDFAAVDDLFIARHATTRDMPTIGPVEYSGIANWPFDKNRFLPYDARDIDHIAVDPQGTIWIETGTEVYSNTTGVFQSVGSGYDAPDIEKSTILDFRKELYFLQEGKRPYHLEWFLRDMDPDSESYHSNYTVDSQNRIWFYDSENGITIVDHGKVKSLHNKPDAKIAYDGGFLLLKDGRVWIGDRGAVWEWKDGQWRKIVVDGEDELFSYFIETENGEIYGATEGKVYKFLGGIPIYIAGGTQDQKPIIIAEDGIFGGFSSGHCASHNFYVVAANCPGLIEHVPYYRYGFLYLDLLRDGSMIYINSHMIAQHKDGRMRSFLFDNISFEAATVDREGNIWVYSPSTGLLRLAPDIFDDYQELENPSVKVQCKYLPNEIPPRPYPRSGGAPVICAGHVE